MYSLAKRAAFALLVISYSCLSLANTGIYIGAEAGFTDVRHGNFEDDTGYNAYLGWSFIKNGAVEMSYGNLGTFELKDNNKASIAVEDVIQLNFAASGVIIKSWGTFIDFRIGGYQLTLNPTIDNGKGVKESDESGLAVGYGFGQPLGTEHFLWTVHAQYFFDIEENVDLVSYSTGLRFKF